MDLVEFEIEMELKEAVEYFDYLEADFEIAKLAEVLIWLLNVQSFLFRRHNQIEVCHREVVFRQIQFSCAKRGH